MELEKLAEKANDLLKNGWRFEFYTANTGWFVKPDAENWLIRTPQGSALPFYEALKKVLRTIEYLNK